MKNKLRNPEKQRGIKNAETTTKRLAGSGKDGGAPGQTKTPTPRTHPPKTTGAGRTRAHQEQTAEGGGPTGLQAGRRRPDARRPGTANKQMPDEWSGLVAMRSRAA